MYGGAEGGGDRGGEHMRVQEAARTAMHGSHMKQGMAAKTYTRGRRDKQWRRQIAQSTLHTAATHKTPMQALTHSMRRMEDKWHPHPPQGTAEPGRRG